MFYNINDYLNDITISLNELNSNIFDTVSESGFRRDTSSAFFGISILLHINIVTCILLNEVNNYVKERKEKEHQNAEFFSTLYKF